MSIFAFHSVTGAFECLMCHNCIVLLFAEVIAYHQRHVRVSPLSWVKKKLFISNISAVRDRHKLNA